MFGSQDEIPPPPPPPPLSSQTPTQQTPHTVSTIKLPILKKGEYDIWAMKMEHYLDYTNYPIWEVIQNGNGPVSITTDTHRKIKVLPPRTAEEIFDGKSDEGFLVRYSLQSKAFKVYNLETKRVEENMHITFLENKPNVAGKGPTWLFDLDYLTDSMNYQPRSRVEDAGAAPHKHPDLKTDEKAVDKEDQVFLDELERLKRQEKDANDAAEALRKDTPVSTDSPYDGLSLSDLTNPEQDDSEIPALEDIYQNPTDGIFTNSSYDDEGAVADFTNL
ncbi:hypothetical protein Tco_0512348 [Tanacetum coccineum]